MPVRDTSASTSPLHVIVVGGGLGGVTAAVVLGKAGLKVDIFEQVRESVTSVVARASPTRY